MSFVAFVDDFEVGQVVTPDDMNQLKDNQAYLLESNIAVATIGSELTSTVTSWTDITGATINLTTHGGHVLVFINLTYFGCAGGSGTNWANLRLVVNGVAQDAVWRRTSIDTLVASLNLVLVLDADDLIVGTNTFKLQWQRTDSGTHTMFLGNDSRLEAMEI